MSTSGSEQGKNVGGKPESWVWDYIDKTGAKDKNGRYPVKCRTCPKTWEAARTEQLRQHLVDACKGLSAEQRGVILGIAASAVDTSVRVPVGSRQQLFKRRDSSAGSSSLDSVTRRLPTVTPKLQSLLDQKLLRWFVSAGNAFNQVDNEFFLDFVYELIPDYLVPGKL